MTATVRRRLLVALALLLAMVVVAGCDAERPTATTFRYDVPKGTRGLVMTNRAPIIFPEQLVVHVGDSIVITNDDDYDIDIGPYRVRANSTVRQRFASPGELEGSCTVADGGSLTVTVLPREE